MKRAAGSRRVCVAGGAAGLLMVAGTALAQNCANGVNPSQCTPRGTCSGPDVIVGDLNGVTNYPSAGTLEAFSIGTTSCNIGNVPLNWIDSTAEHPVISQALYKLSVVNGVSRFEQLGMSWLKHGFFALSENLCCSGCVGFPDGSHLGLHCSDPYNSTRNGSQAGLGPRWQVNAATGVFPYPPANPLFSGSVARRLQVPIAALENSSASVQYFITGQYVTHDDATAGNKYNNESYRACLISGSGVNWNMSLSGTTQRGQQGSRAWGAGDAAVAYSDVFVPTDGLVIVAARATDLGGGQWNYSYAVQNMNSDRSVSAISIPVPAGVTVTNIGFHDVDYHDGDGPKDVNFSGVDWTPSMTEGSVSTGSLGWSTESFAANSNANAIRWGTMYNFRFDADAAPLGGGGAVSLRLFKPGTPAEVQTSSLPVPGGLPTCPCDWNQSGQVSSQDYFDFLDSFFGNTADFNRDGETNSQDYFDFLTCFFTLPQGCS